MWSIVLTAPRTSWAVLASSLVSTARGAPEGVASWKPTVTFSGTLSPISVFLLCSLNNCIPKSPACYQPPVRGVAYNRGDEGGGSGDVAGKFVHLHNHTEYSLLDGAQRLGQMIEQAKRLRMPALAITDHGVMYGAVAFYQKAREAGLKPILGVEAYIAPGARTEKQGRGAGQPYYHLVLLARN